MNTPIRDRISSLNSWLSPHRGVAMVMLWASLLVCQAQSYSIDWHKIAGGGGTGAGGNYFVSGTIGQHDASAPMSSGNYSLTGGFWVLTQAVQTPGAPTLYISSADHVVTISWQDVAGWSLQQNSDLTSPGGWSASSGVSPVNGTNYLTLTYPAGYLFFRLAHP
jgi:hypothetical protein